MIRIENECVGCPPEIGCFRNSCPYWAVKRYYCDNCEDERKLYWFNGKQLCIGCIEEQLEEVVYDE